MDIEAMARKGQEMFLPNLSIDIVILGFHESELKVLLLEYGGKWMLPGGFIYMDESMEQASERILQERTGLSRFYLKLFKIFGDADRAFPDTMVQLFKKAGMPWSKELWVNGRFVSAAYYALTNIEEVQPIGGFFAENIKWHSLQQLPAMYFDHRKIASSILEKMQGDFEENKQFSNLLPEKFTMPELHQLHEHIMDKKLDRSRFQKKMFSLGIFERLAEVREGVPHRKPFLYRLKQ